MYRLKNETMIYEAGRGWYSIIEKIFELETAPIEEIRVLIEGKFPLVKFSCWSTEQLKSYFHHLPTRFVTFVYADKDFLQPLKDFLEDSGYNVYLNPTVTETAKYVDLKNHTAILRPPISYRDSNNQQLAKIDKERIRNINLRGGYAILNKLKPISPASFYLWVVALYGNSGGRSRFRENSQEVINA
jgi:hypothetical protein